MKKKSKAYSEEMMEVLGMLPLPEDEQMALFLIRGEFVAAVEPKDFVDGVWVEDLAYYTSQILQLRQIRAGLIRSQQLDILITVLQMLVKGGALKPETDIIKLARQYVDDKHVRSRFEKLLPEGFSFEMMTAKAFCRYLSEHRAIEQMLESMEAKRIALLREIERRRASFAQRLRTAESTILAAENIKTDEAETEETSTNEPDGEQDNPLRWERWREEMRRKYAPMQQSDCGQGKPSSAEAEGDVTIETKIENGSPQNPIGFQNQTDTSVATDGEGPPAPLSSTSPTPQMDDTTSLATSKPDDSADSAGSAGNT